MQRLEVGMVVPAVFQAQAQKVMTQLAIRFRGTVKAGHMIGL